MSDRLSVHKRNDGFWEVLAPWPASEEEFRELEALIEAARAMGVVHRVCHDRDSNGNKRPQKVLLTVDPALIKV